LYSNLFYTWTNKHYRRVSSGGNECARSSRRGAGLTSSSLGAGLDPDGPQGHTVVTQKRKLRTPIWARLRNIHISNPLYDPCSIPYNPLIFLRFLFALFVDFPQSAPYPCRSLSSSFLNRFMLAFVVRS